jgi:hypothetical protein
MKTAHPIRTACALVALCSCAGYPAPTDHLANAYANIRTAQEMGATASPQAALHLRLAQEEQATAKGFLGQSKNEQADYMALRASADAELAIAMTREMLAETKATEAAAHATAAASTDSASTSEPSTPSGTTTTTSTTVPTNGPAK